MRNRNSLIIGENIRIRNRLKYIEKKIDKLDKSSFAIAMYASGFPILVIGFAQMIDSIIKNNSYSYIDYVYFSTGILMVGIGMRIYYNRKKQAIITLLAFVGVLIVLVLLRTFIPINLPN